MKLWKSKKNGSSAANSSNGAHSAGTSSSCVPGKFAKQHSEEKTTAPVPAAGAASAASTSSSTTISGERAMSPAQSEDSGLAPDRGTTYATISLPRDNAAAMGIVLAERTDLSYPPVIAAISPYGPASDFLAPGDRLHQIDGISTIGLSNMHVQSILLHGDGGPAQIEIEYCLPDYVSQNSLCVSTKLAQICVERENNCLGLTLRGGGEVPLIVTNVRPHGPVFKTGRIKPGDRLLRVDNISLINKTLLEAQQILKSGCSGPTNGLANLTIEYDVSVMQSVEFSLGPLLIEIERPLNDPLGLVLSNYSVYHQAPADLSTANDLQPAGVYVSSVLAASIADRCGAVTLGDQILSVDETMVENTALSPDDVMALLDAPAPKGYTQLQIMPCHAQMTRRGANNTNFNTIESRKHHKNNHHQQQQQQQQRKYTRKSSLPMMMSLSASSTSTPASNPGEPTIGWCRSETVSIMLDCSQGSGLVLGNRSACGRGHIVAQVLPGSVADRSGCLFKGDRVLSINKLYNLDATVIRQILGDHQPNAGNSGGNGTLYRGASMGNGSAPHWCELEIEFNMSDSVVPASGVFNVKLAKLTANAGLGITVNATGNSSGSNGSGGSSGGSGSSFVISEVKPGSLAHRTGSLRAGDILLAVDAHQLQHFNVDALLKENRNEFTTLTIKRTSLPDFLFDAQQRAGGNIYSNVGVGADLYGNAGGYKSKLGLMMGDLSLKAQSCQPELYSSINAMGDVTPDGMPAKMTPLMGTSSAQIRRPFLAKAGSTESSFRRTVAQQQDYNNTHSLTTEADLDAEGLYHEANEYHQRNKSFDSNTIPPPMENRIYGSSAAASRHLHANNNTTTTTQHQLVFTVRLDAQGGPLGITLSGSENEHKPILISAMLDDGCAFSTRQVQIGDILLAINGDSVQDVPLSRATKLLQQSIGAIVELKLARNVCDNEHPQYATPPPPLPVQSLMSGAQPQAVYAKVQRRAERSAAALLYNNDVASAASTASSSSASSLSASANGGQAKEKLRTFQVTLYKDTVYDDYGFSLSDGLYERGVFINRIRSGGPADVVGLLKPFDRIMQVNGVKTQDFDCCLTVPLIASAGDKIDLVLQRSTQPHQTSATASSSTSTLPISAANND